jgi:hypothetical protein
MKKRNTDQLSATEVERRFIAALARALATPHKPHKPLKAKKTAKKKGLRRNSAQV